jgi:hypothetical protein
VILFLGSGGLLGLNRDRGADATNADRLGHQDHSQRQRLSAGSPTPDQGEEPTDRLGRDAAGDPGGLRLLGLPQRGPDDPMKPIPGWRLDLLLPQMRQQPD